MVSGKNEFSIRNAVVIAGFSLAIGYAALMIWLIA